MKMEPLLLPWILKARKRKSEAEYSVIPRKIFHTSPQFRLIFYDARGNVEASRMILAFARIPFEDVRLKIESEWIQAKKSLY